MHEEAQLDENAAEQKVERVSGRMRIAQDVRAGPQLAAVPEGKRRRHGDQVSRQRDGESAEREKGFQLLIIQHRRGSFGWNWKIVWQWRQGRRLRTGSIRRWKI